MRATVESLKVLRRMAADRKGTTAIEYALIAGGISIAILTVVVQVGDSMKTLFYDKLAGMF